MFSTAAIGSRDSVGRRAALVQVDRRTAAHGLAEVAPAGVDRRQAVAQVGRQHPVAVHHRGVVDELAQRLRRRWVAHVLGAHVGHQLVAVDGIAVANSREQVAGVLLEHRQVAVVGPHTGRIDGVDT